MLYTVFERLIFGAPWLIFWLMFLSRFGSCGVFCRFLGFFYLVGSG